MTVLPQHVEARMVQLSKELDQAHSELAAAEHSYVAAKSGYEIAAAKSRMMLGRQYAERGLKLTVQEKDDLALLETADEYIALNTAEAVVKAARANQSRVRTQCDLARSINSSVRASLEM